MHLRELYQNNGNKGIRLAEGIFSGQRILLTSTDVPVSARNYFGVIVAIDSYCPAADIVIHTQESKSSYSKNKLREPEGEIFNAEKIHIISEEKLSYLTKARLSLNFPSLVYRNSTERTTSLLGNRSSNFLSNENPGMHLALIGDAYQVYSLNLPEYQDSKHIGFKSKEELEVFMADTALVSNIRVIKNLWCPNRDSFSKTVIWWPNI